LDALIASPDGRRIARGEGTGTTPAEAARACIAALRAAGADEVLAELNRGSDA
jgi:phage terminase large subunit-like protein